MELLNDDCPCTLNEIELFDPTPKQIVLDKARDAIYTPLSSIASTDGVVVFNVEGSSNEYIDLSETKLTVDVKVVNSAANANLAATDIVAPVNNWLHSMFSDVKLEIQNKTVEGGDHLYPYKAYLLNLLSHSKESKKTQLVASGWFKDEGQMNGDETTNTGFSTRKDLIAGSRIVQLSGPLLLDMMYQPRYLMPKTGFKLSLTRMKPEFQICIRTANTVAGRATGVNVMIQSATLQVRRVQALPSVIDDLETKLSLTNAVYPIQRTVMKTFIIGQGQASFHCQNLFDGQLPKLIVLGLTRNNAYTGAYNQNPFNFQHANVNSIKLYDSSNTAIYAEMTPDFANKRYANEYTNLFKALGIFNKSESFDVTYKDFANGYALYAFNLAPDLHISGHSQLERNATIRLDLGFTAANANSLNLVAMGILDGRIDITKERNVVCGWQ